MHMPHAKHFDALTVHARDMEAPWAPPARNRVKRRGDRLGKIVWQGRQWVVTARGVECRDGCYSITCDRLWEEEEVFGWVAHMAEKDWVDLEDFAEALRIARILSPS
jgi:hypothetical protein